MVTCASVLLQVPVEVGVDVDTVVMGRPRISKCPQRTFISKGPMQSSTNQLLRLERAPKTLERRRQARLTKQRRRHTTRKAPFLIPCRRPRIALLPQEGVVVEEVAADEAVAGLEVDIGERKRESGMLLLSGNLAVLD